MLLFSVVCFVDFICCVCWLFLVAVLLRLGLRCDCLLCSAILVVWF